MQDTILHPLDAFRSHGQYRALKGELAALVRDTAPSAAHSELLGDALGGKINFPDAYILKRLLRRYRPAEILEVGSFVGFSTRWLLENSTEWNGKVTSVDPNIRHRRIDVPGDILKKLNAGFLDRRLEVIEAFFGAPGSFYDDYEAYEPKWSRESVDELLAKRPVISRDWDRTFDFIFIDGEHSYRAVKENFEIAETLLKKGGCIAFHDPLSWPGVKEALDEIARKYAGRADVEIFGKWDHRILQGLLGRSTSGIGFFKMREGKDGAAPRPVHAN